MEQAFGKYLMFRNRLEKVYRHLGKQARKQEVSCFRLYDHDLPDFPLLIEVYESHLYVSEYKRNHGMDDVAHEQWLEECKRVMSDVIRIDPEKIFLKIRQRKPGRGGQYQRLDEEGNEFIVSENGLKFIVNLSDYLDTGLFLDHRNTRQMVREISSGKNVLNLFSYTGSFSTYAAAGGARKVLSVDLSKTYLQWGERNLQLNFPDYSTHESVHADVKQFLKTIAPESFDLIIMDPPTFSNSKRMEDFLDIQRDHAGLINDCMVCLREEGLLFFSTNFTKFRLDTEKISAKEIKDITRQTTPFDFEGKLKRQCFRIKK